MDCVRSDRAVPSHKKSELGIDASFEGNLKRFCERGEYACLDMRVNVQRHLNVDCGANQALIQLPQSETAVPISCPEKIAAIWKRR